LTPPATGSAARELARKIYDGLARGTIDRALLTPAARAFFSEEAVSDYAKSLAPLGTPSEFAATGESQRWLEDPFVSDFVPAT
jgi:D-alanyl-D-alanine carboxypeptidase